MVGPWWRRGFSQQGERSCPFQSSGGISGKALFQGGEGQRPFCAEPVTGKVRGIIAGDVLQLYALEARGGVAKIVFDQVKESAVEVKCGAFVGLPLEPLDLFPRKLTLGSPCIGFAKVKGLDVAHRKVKGACGEILTSEMQCRQAGPHGMKPLIFWSFGIQRPVVRPQLSGDLFVDQALVSFDQGLRCNPTAGGRYRSTAGTTR